MSLASKTTSKKQLPAIFKPLFWSYKFSKLDPEKDIKRIVINSVNYGNWEHWQWLAVFYGKERLKQVIVNIPESEFRIRALHLFSLIFGIKKLKYAFRSDKIRAEKSFR